MSWSFHNPTRVIFGAGAVSMLQKQIESVGAKRPLVLTTSGMVHRGLKSKIDEIAPTNSWSIVDGIGSNPTLLDTEKLVEQCRTHNPDLIIAWGGGSVIDSAKVISAVLVAPSHWSLRASLVQSLPWHGMNVIPVIAIPTTAGTGAEVTPFATIWDSENRKKLSFANQAIFPRIAIVDPELLKGSPIDVLRSCGLDALCQALESIWNRNATPATDAWAQRATTLAMSALPGLLSAQPSELDFEQIAQASLLAGLCISQTRTALAHAMSYPMTARFGVPHGLACGITLPAIMRFNSEADSENRIHKTAQLNGFENPNAWAAALDDLLASTGAKSSLLAYIPRADMIIPFASEMLHPGRSDNNLRAAQMEDIVQILKLSVI